MKEKRAFPIFNSHLDLAHQTWAKAAQPGDWAIDATCGNGWDSLYLADQYEGVIGIDIQETAIEKTRQQLLEHQNVHLFCQSHETFPALAQNRPIRLIVYNLGYLPGGDKQLTTRVQSTLTSIQNGLELILPGGLMSITCYPGHPEGESEQKAILQMSQTLSSQKWSVCFHTWENRLKAPSLLLIQRSL